MAPGPGMWTTASRRKSADSGKIRRDFKQPVLVARKIETDKDLQEELAGIVAGLPDDLRQKMQHGAESVAEYVKSPDFTEEDELQIRRVIQGI